MTGRTQQGEYYASSEFARLNAATSGRASPPVASFYALGLDWARLFDRKGHSAGVLCFRCALPSFQCISISSSRPM